MQLGGNLWGIAANVAPESHNSLLVYTCDKSCIGAERDKKSHEKLYVLTSLNSISVNRCLLIWLYATSLNWDIAANATCRYKL